MSETDTARGKERWRERESIAVRCGNVVGKLSLSGVSLVLNAACRHCDESRRILHGIKELGIIVLITGVALLWPLHTCQ